MRNTVQCSGNGGSRTRSYQNKRTELHLESSKRSGGITDISTQTKPCCIEENGVAEGENDPINICFYLQSFLKQVCYFYAVSLPISGSAWVSFR